MQQSEQSLPPNHRLQIASYDFKFDIITSSQSFQRFMQQAVANDHVRDVCDDSLSHLSEQEIAKIPYRRYINIVQKSPTWLFCRARAHGTASSVGKYIKSPCRYPTLEQIKENWHDKITQKPFEKTHTMLGHMNWGVGYEDPALIHFALEEKVGVIQVGTIRVDLSFILTLGKQIYGKSWIALPKIIKDQHLLISPDGIVGKPEYRDQTAIKTGFYKNLLGMLEIKCMSPFYHVETSDNFLQWVDDIETRQWQIADQIPFVYITQMGLQAISGAHSYKMTPKHIMWFIRWSPHGFSVYQFQFKYLIRLGILVSNLYFSLIQRTHSVDDIDKLYPLEDDEAKVEKMMYSAYRDVIKYSTRKYVPISDYPEFDLYNEITQHFLFKVPDIDPDTLMLDLPKNKTAETKQIETGDFEECLM